MLKPWFFFFQFGGYRILFCVDTEYRIKNKFTFIVFGPLIIECIAIIILPEVVCLYLKHKFVRKIYHSKIFVPSISSKIQRMKNPSVYLGLVHSLKRIKS